MELILFIVVGIAFFKIGVIRSLYKKSEAATAIQMLLEHQRKFGFFEGDPGEAARQYVQNAWNDKPQVLSGKFGQRPHKLSVVVYSLALAAHKLSQNKNSNYGSILIALGNAFSEVEANGSFYPLTIVDHALIEEAMGLYLPLVQKEAGEADRLLAGFDWIDK